MSRLDVHRAEIRHDDGTTVERIVMGSGEPWHLPPLEVPETTEPPHFGRSFLAPSVRAGMDPALPFEPQNAPSCHDWRAVQAMRLRRVGLLVGALIFIGCVAGYLIA